MTGSEAAPLGAAAAYRSLIRDVISPAMRALGFKGSGGTYVLPAAHAWAIVGFQRSVHDDSANVSCTVNLTVASKSTWATVRAARPYLPERPAANTRYGPAVWQRRLGSLTPAQTDVWWHVTAETDIAGLGAEVLAALLDHGLPRMTEEIDRIAAES